MHWPRWRGGCWPSSLALPALLTLPALPVAWRNTGASQVLLPCSSPWISPSMPHRPSLRSWPWWFAPRRYTPPRRAVAGVVAWGGRARRICGKRRDGVAQGHGDRGALSGALSWGVQGGAGRRAGSSSVSDGHGFERGKAVQRLEAFFTPVAAGFDAAER